MLIRFVVKNLFSFNEATEFNMLPGKATRLKHHKYKLNDEIEVLKLAAIYGANASGKSNLIKAIRILQEIVKKNVIPNNLAQKKFKLNNANKNLPSEFSLEFILNEITYYYTVSINEGKIIEEYLSKESNNESLLFHRKISENDKISIQFYDEFMENEKNVLLKDLIENNLLKDEQSLLYLLTTLNNNNEVANQNGLIEINTVQKWISNFITIIAPNSKYNALPFHLESRLNFKEFCIDILKSANTGIVDLQVDTITIEEFFGKDNFYDIHEIENKLKTSKLGYVNKTIDNEIYNFCFENNKIVAKKVIYISYDEKIDEVKFDYNELSDGTKRIIDFLVILFNISHLNPVYIIDEIERSIHPLLIKEIISKFSKEQNTKGQLIFTSHESNLLDQDILRTDEIWFAEKNKKGETKLYSLSDFKEHSTIDIRKGYLQGRYGGIPFISNLQDLNWHKEDVVAK